MDPQSTAEGIGWVNWLNQNSGIITAAATYVIAVFAIVTAFLTRTLAGENRLLRKAETEPEVVVYFTTDRDRWPAISFVLANIGRGPAMKVAFTLEFDSEDFRNHGVSFPFSKYLGYKGINVLPQGENVQSDFGHGVELLKDPQLKPFDVHISYQNLTGRTYEARQQLDVTQLAWVIWLYREVSK